MLILGKDKVKTANVIVDSEAVDYPVSNLKSDRKSSTWRSNNTSNASITVSFDQAIDNDFVGFALNNFDANTSIQLDYIVPGDLESRSSPIQIPGTNWCAFDIGNETNAYSVAIKTDGTLWAWGCNEFGQLGQNDTIDRSSPVQIPGTNWCAVSAGYQHVHAVKTDGTLWSWGNGGAGRLGYGIGGIPQSSPVQIPGTTWDKISAGLGNSIATRTDGTLWTWGSNASGQLGQSNTIDRSSPIQILGNAWRDAAVGTISSVVATKTDGTLWAWGNNITGSLGQNDTIDRSSPIQIPGTNWNKISLKNSFVLATKTDGTLWAWGAGGTGVLGQNNTIPRSSPVQIPGTDWDKISAGSFHSLATRTDGTLWAWGKGTEGQLGNNLAQHRSSPIQIPGTDWNRVAAGANNSMATKTANTLWAWGYNNIGQLATGKLQQSFPPVTVGQVFDPPEGFDTNNSSSFAYGGGNYFSIQTPNHQVHDINITIDSSTNPDGFIEISRLVAGKSIQTNYGASIGVVSSLDDRSEVTRTEAGDSVVDYRPVTKSLEFNLAHLNKSERAELINIFRSVGKRNPVYVSLAQGKDEDFKKSMEIYGRLDDLSLILNELYVSECSIKIDEI
ncbi:alpha-tubulin suppressor-like RCC1 family protein [Nitrosomonas nitrosa]|uniref:RCC1 domain-containing protein n=1 Tax=Nitrosomonas nitrosa TaxID=52442 RepID=UPI000D32846F|nr:hypothetical protein [Nitrosomonas nitrosa]PTR04974.1 alpha-tubulin suppressor-like RCC1 family protein [Nitrosomonas nitrosa]